MLSELVKKHRERRGMTQGDLAREAKVSPQTVNYIERGRQTVDRIYTSTRKAIFLALEAAEAFSDADRSEFLKALDLPENLRGSVTATAQELESESIDNPHILAALLIAQLGEKASVTLLRSLLASHAAATQSDEPPTTTLRKVNPPINHGTHTEQTIETITAKTPATLPPQPARTQATRKQSRS